MVSPASFRFEMMNPTFRNTESNRSFWSLLTKSCIKRAFYNPPKAFVDACFDLVIHINTTPHTPITVVWNQDLPHYDSTCDDFEDPGYHVTVSFLPLVDAYASWTAWRTDSRHGIFRLDGGGLRWLQQDNIQYPVVPSGSSRGPQIDLLRKEIPRYFKKKACKRCQDS